MLIRAVCVRNWVIRFRILNWESVSIAGTEHGISVEFQVPVQKTTGGFYFLGRIIVCGGCFRWLRIRSGSSGRLLGLSCGWKHSVGCPKSGVCEGILLLACLRVGAIWWCLTLILSLCSFFCMSAGYREGWWPSCPLLFRSFIDSVSVLSCCIPKAANLSALSYPSIPVWLGTHVSLVRVPLGLKMVIISRVAVTASFSDNEFVDMAVMTELESLYMMASGGHHMWQHISWPPEAIIYVVQLKLWSTNMRYHVAS